MLVLLCFRWCGKSLNESPSEKEGKSFDRSLVEA